MNGDLFSNAPPRVFWTGWDRPQYNIGGRFFPDGKLFVYGTAGAETYLAANCGGWGIGRMRTEELLHASIEHDFYDLAAAQDAMNLIMRSAGVVDGPLLFQTGFSPLFLAINVLGYFEETGDAEVIQFLGSDAVRLEVARRDHYLARKACWGRSVGTGNPLYEAERSALVRLKEVEQQIKRKQEAAEDAEEKEILAFVRKMESQAERAG
jgi:hypothetical protein